MQNFEIKKQIESAKLAIAKHSYTGVACIVELKLSKTARKSSFGFFFSDKAIEIGTVINNNDGSVSKVVACVDKFYKKD